MLVGWRYYLLTFSATVAAAVAGSAASMQSQQFYEQLERPAWAPSPQVFGPVWTLLYLMIAISGGVAISAAPKERRITLAALFLVQLLLNALWTWLFFVWRNGALAFVDIVALQFSILIMIVVFWRISKFASYLLVPYLAWVSFAAVLNYAIWRTNPSLL